MMIMRTISKIRFYSLHLSMLSSMMLLKGLMSRIAVTFGVNVEYMTISLITNPFEKRLMSTI
jgi:hypothetical protein